MAREKRLLQKTPRHTIEHVIGSFREAVEARCISQFWESRQQNRLVRQPEDKGQGLLAIYVRGVLSNGKRGSVWREVPSGTGYVDLAVFIANTPHLVEMKILKSSKFVGLEQLQTYMRMEKRRKGWLVIFDARPPAKKTKIQTTFDTPDGRIEVVVIDINPLPPSSYSH